MEVRRRVPLPTAKNRMISPKERPLRGGVPPVDTRSYATEDLVLQLKDFSDARESASPPRSTKINIPAASAPRTAKLYHFPSPRVNYRARPNWHPAAAVLGLTRG